MSVLLTTNGEEFDLSLVETRNASLMKDKLLSYLCVQLLLKIHYWILILYYPDNPDYYHHAVWLLFLVNIINIINLTLLMVCMFD